MLLDGMRVISFCHCLHGPAATQYLADMGAEVIKIEPPGGPLERKWSGGDSFVDGVSSFFLSADRPLDNGRPGGLLRPHQCAKQQSQDQGHAAPQGRDQGTSISPQEPQHAEIAAARAGSN